MLSLQVTSENAGHKFAQLAHRQKKLKAFSSFPAKVWPFGLRLVPGSSCDGTSGSFAASKPSSERASSSRRTSSSSSSVSWPAAAKIIIRWLHLQRQNLTHNLKCHCGRAKSNENHFDLIAFMVWISITLNSFPHIWRQHGENKEQKEKQKDGWSWNEKKCQEVGTLLVPREKTYT